MTTIDTSRAGADVFIDEVPEDEFTTLDALESEAIHIFREVAGEFERPVILFSGGKDSTLLLHLALKAFWPAPVRMTPRISSWSGIY